MIYLDNAATSFPKPRRVWEEQERCMRSYCGNAGRGSHRLAMRAAEKIYECREQISQLMGCSHPENVIFTMNTTAAINTVVKGLLHRGDHVLISDLEHNAVWRPICKLAREGKITYGIFPSYAVSIDRSSKRICQGIEEMIRPNTRMLICTQASNICSATMPVGEIGALCRRHGIIFVVDGAQSAGHLPISMEEMGIDALCLPGHKGLMGVQGSGCLILGEDVYAETLMEGGSGFNSLDEAMPEESPERYEAGTLPTPAIAGLCEGVRFVSEVGVQTIAAHEHELCRLMKERLQSLGRVKLLAPELIGGVLLFYAEGIASDVLGAELDKRGICVRSGFHCAALAHRTLETPSDGAVRVSAGYFNRPSDADALWKAMKEILK